MRISLSKRLILAFFCYWAGVSILQAQQEVYLTSATLKVSVGDETEFWVNGDLLMTLEPLTDPGSEVATHEFKKLELCKFGKENILVFKLQQHLEQYSNLRPNEKIGIAFFLKMTYSDGKGITITSGQLDQFSTLRIDPGQPEPAGWQAMEFNDSSWQTPEGAPPSVIIKFPLEDPFTHQPEKYLAAYTNDDRLRQSLGQKKLFRRKLQLPIDIDPSCPGIRRAPPTKTPTPSVKLIPTPTPPPPPPPTPTFTPLPPPPPKATPTPRPLPTLIPTPTPPPAAPTPTPIPTIRVRPTPTVEILVPTATPTAEPIVVIPTAPPTKNPPVNVFVDFSGASDNPAVYKVEIVNAGGGHVRTLFNKKVSTDGQKWIEWDGKDDSGQMMQAGEYFAILSVGGEARPKVALHWWPANPDEQ